MIYTCPKCSSKFQCDVAGTVACPTCGATVRIEAPAIPGNPWDRASKGGFVTAFFETVKLSIVDPVAFFGQVGGGTGWMRPWGYALIISFVVFTVAAAYQAGFQALAIGIDIAAELKKTLFPLAALSIPLSVGALAGLAIVVVPIFTTGILFLQAAIYHLCLIILGAARRDFWATFRTACYASGPQLFQIIPILGGAIGPLWQLVLVIVGLKVVHRTSYGRSTLAVFLPTILCCGAVLLIAMAIAGGVMGALLAHAH